MAKVTVRQREHVLERRVCPQARGTLTIDYINPNIDSVSPTPRLFCMYGFSCMRDTKEKHNSGLVSNGNIYDNEQ